MLNEQEETLFDAARRLSDPAQRKAFLDAACDKDSGLRQRLEELLTNAIHAEKFFRESGAPRGLPSQGEDWGDRAAKGGTVRLSPDEQLKESIGRYKIREQIGEGGCGVVYVAEQEEPVRRRVALKLIKPGMDTKQVIARFEAERQALAMMDHPNIAKVLDGGTTGSGRPYFVMELVRGVRITEYCDQNHLDTTQRLELFVQVCNAVQHAHQKGIIHRDLKPSNILVTLHDGVPVPKVIDFGIAKALEGRLTDLTVYTELRQFIGTPVYTSPEQAEMSGLDIDTRSDIYSLGVLLYELLTGRTPFDPKELLKCGLEEIRRTIREVEPPRPSTCLSTLANLDLTEVAKHRRLEAPKLISLIRGDLDWIVMKCLEKDRTRRYDTASGIGVDLKRFLFNEPVLARPPSRLYLLQRLAQRNKVAFTASGIVLLALVVGLGVTSWALLRERVAHREADKARVQEKQQRLRAEGEELSARRFAYGSDMNLVQQSLAANNLGRARELLARNQPKPGQLDLRGWEWRYLWRYCQSDSLFRICKQPGSVMAVAFLAKGEVVATRDVYGKPVIWDLTSRRKLVELPGSGAGRAMAVSADGNLLGYGGRDATGAPTINIWNVQAKSVVAQLNSQAALISLALSPSGKSLAAFCVDRRMRLWDLSTQGPPAAFTASREDGMHKGVLAFSPDEHLLAVGGTDGQVRLLEIPTGTEKLRFAAAAEGITALAFSSDGMLLASGAGFSDRTVRLWDPTTGKPMGDLTGHNSWISALAFAPNSHTLASANGDQTIRIWNTANRQQVSILRGHLDEVYSVAFSPDAKTVLSGSKDGEVSVWNAVADHDEKGGVTLPVPVFKYAFSPDGNDLVTLNRDGKVLIWDPLTVRQKETIATVGGDGEMAICRNGKLLGIGDRTGKLRIWDLTTRRETSTFSLCSGQPLYVGFLSGDQELLVVDCERKVRRWETASWHETASWKIEQNANACCLSPSGRVLVTGDGGGWVTFRDVATGRELKKFAAHHRVITGVSFSPDGKLLATSSEDGLTKLWDPGTYQELAALRGSLLSVHSVTISPDGQRLATGSNGKEAVKVWDLATRQELASLEGRGSFFYRTGFSPEGDVLVSVNSDGLFHVWRTPSLKEIEAAESANSKSE